MAVFLVRQREREAHPLLGSKSYPNQREVAESIGQLTPASNGPEHATLVTWNAWTAWLVRFGRLISPVSP